VVRVLAQALLEPALGATVPLRRTA
jgi:hypothetical protein